MSGSPGTSSSSDSSVELHAENALCIGGRTGGMLMTLGASSGLLANLFGDCGGVRIWKESSGHEQGEI